MAKKAKRKSSKRKSTGRKTKRKSAKSKKRRTSQIPLPILEKRLARLGRVVASRRR